MFKHRQGSTRATKRSTARGLVSTLNFFWLSFLIAGLIAVTCSILLEAYDVLFQK
jgi:hypothetical protein